MRAYHFTALTSGVLFLSLTFSSAAQSPVTDLGRLNLKVAEPKVVPELPLSSGGGQFSVRPEKGMKLVVVTLSGELKAPGRYIVSPPLFAVLYEESQPASSPAIKIAGAHHVAMEESQWVTSYVTDATRPGPVTIRFSVTVPEAVGNVHVLYGTAIGSQVQLVSK